MAQQRTARSSRLALNRYDANRDYGPWIRQSIAKAVGGQLQQINLTLAAAQALGGQLLVTSPSKAGYWRERARLHHLPSHCSGADVPSLSEADPGTLAHMRQRVNKIVREAATLASMHLAARDLPELPNTTPHTLRRTCISIALLANRFDVLWVMRQVVHADSKMTMDVYAQLRQRAQREHGKAFDALVRNARGRLYGEVADADHPADSGVPADRSLEDLVDEWRDEAGET